MAASIFDLKLVEPNERMLSVELKQTKKYFDEICFFLKEEYGDVRHEWKFYNNKSGWILKLINKRRNVLFVVPCSGYFRAVFTLGGKAVAGVITSKLPVDIKNKLLTSKKHTEGRTIQLDVKNKKQSENILQLIQIKLKN